MKARECGRKMMGRKDREECEKRMGRSVRKRMGRKKKKKKCEEKDGGV